jgi:16S rRNA (cytosine967-C5)-methyltransferase
LLRVATQDAYADEALRGLLTKSVGVEDARLATELSLGALRWQRLLDFLIDAHLTKASKALDPEVRIALRLGVYQLYFFTRVPAHAAVHESVELVKLARKRSAAPLVNAVLRKIAKESAQTKSVADTVARILPKEISTGERLGIRYSHPTWLVERWLHTFGPERARALLEENNRVPALSGYFLNTQHREETLSALQKSRCTVKPGRLVRDSLTLEGGNPAASDAARSGWLAIQDEASQAVARLLGVSPGNSVLDLCAAPGGKTLRLALDAGPNGQVVATDLHAHRVRTMAERLERAGIRNVESLTLDATAQLPFERRFDRILVDVPCSGTGTLARHPEIRWRLRPEDLADLHARQTRLLQNALPHLTPGGRLIYSTCSLEPEENENVVNEVLGVSGDAFVLVGMRKAVEGLLLDSVPADSAIGTDGFFRTFPPEHGTDGFFAAAIERNPEKH